MYRNKKDIDKYVENLISKLSVKEFRARAYSVARLYFEVGDYTSCQKYVEQYLTQKDNNAAAHRLLAQALQKLGQKEKALEQYKISLDIDATQTNLVLEICELLSEDDVMIDPGRAKYWCEKAETIFPKHPISFRLREKLLSLSNKDPETLGKLLTAEMEARPKDVLLHIRLMKHYMELNQIKEVINHSLNVEFGENSFFNNYHWYETLSEILKHYSENGNDWTYQLLLLTVRERICALSLTETPNGTSKSLVESNDLLHLYDQALDNVVKAGALNGFGDFHFNLVNHHKGQFALHAATFLLKKAKKDQISWREASKTAAPLMLIAWHTTPLDPSANALSSQTHTPNKQQEALLRWHLEGAHRCSQSGHYLLSNIRDKTQSFLDEISQCFSGTHWRDKIYEKIFINRDHLAKIRSSYLASNAFNGPVLRLPRKNEVETYDINAQKLFASSLHHMVWILLQYKKYSDFKCTLFNHKPIIPMTTNCGPETLNKLDITAFLYCATKTTQQKVDQQMSFNFRDKPIVLPASITELLCSLPQMKWWDCAYKFCQNELGTEFTDIRATLSRGIEVVRCIDNHGLDPELLYSLGTIFSEQAKSTLEVDEKNYLEMRAGLYYSSAIPLLEKLKSKISIKFPDKRLFDYTHKELSNKDLINMLEESKLYVAVNYYNENEYEKVIEILSKSKSAKAYHQLSLTYKKMALECDCLSPDITTETKTKCYALLTKAKHFAYKAVDKLKDDDVNKNSPIYSDTQELIEVIEANLNKIDTDLSESNNINGKYSSDENTSPRGTDNISSRINTHIFRNFSSTPKPALNMNATNYRTAVDSQLQEQTYIDQHCLERIETQIRNLQKRDTTINDFMDQTRDWFEENRKLSNQIINSVQCNMQNTTEQFQLLKISVDHVKTQIEECRNDCKDVGDIKKQIEELKKELNKLKKASSDQAINERDLYNLDDNYRNNDSSTSFVPQLPFQPSQVMPPFNSRLVPPFPVPPNPYQLYGQNLYNLYNQYSQLIQPPSVSGGPPLFDSNRHQMNYSSVYPTPDQMYLDVAHLVPSHGTGAATVAPVPPVPSMPTVPVVPAMHATPAIPNMPSQSLPVITTKSVPTTEVKKALPVNVVITSSDPLPTCTTASPPVLSVTIPPKHIKGIAHNYQIPMPSMNETKNMPPSLFNYPGSANESATTTASSLPNWNRLTAFSQASPTTCSSGSIMNSLNTDNKTVVDGVSYSMSPDNSLNKSRTLSEKSNTSIENYDPCPDFKPIIPLPAEVKVTTGEEDEVIIFSARAKLFRFIEKQWKERGLGEIKLLKHKVSGKVRVLMRREQIHKICANHIITSEMEIKPMQNETKAYFWVANDFADETIVLEKFCIRFKTADIAQKFYEAFEKARQECVSSNAKLNKTLHNETSTLTPNLLNSEKTMSIASVTSTNIKLETEQSNEQAVNPVKTVVGGFTFSNTPTFKTTPANTKVDTFSETTSNKPNIFGNFSFKTNTTPLNNIFNNAKSEVVKSDAENKQESPVKLNISDTLEEFEPTVEFKPLIPLPALVDKKTGEEDEIILFEHRAKLLRYDSSSKEWKERGLGNIKILMHKDNNQKVRLLMRREQVMKVCCNHSITKEMLFEKMPNVDKAVTWCAKDFSEGELVPETFCLRFKTAAVCNDFIEALNSAQSKIKEESKAAKEEQNAAKQSNFGFGDKFKLKVGSWNCPICYTNNLEDYKKCACCEELKPDDSGGLNNNTTGNKESSSNWGENFKPKFGTWECKDCLIRNEPNVEFCAACCAAKDPSVTKTQNKGTSNDTFKFSFGIPPKSTASSSTVFGWGDQFKPKEGTWECKQCLIRNESNLENCSACNSAKNSDSLKTVVSLGNALETKFKFGIAETPNEDKSKSQTTSIFDGTGVHKFRFGVSSNANDNASNIVSFGDNKPTGVIFATPKANDNDCPINFTLKKSDKNNALTPAKPALLPTPQSNIISSSLPGKDTSTFDFVFKPKTPPKGKSPIKSDKVDESDDNEYVSEDEGQHIHFSPVIPMPDKIKVITGEENEDEMYAHRAKLYRFLSGEWKERGIGVVKILKNKETGKLRVVMRREQVLKICLNHALTPEIIYTPKDDKTWLFTANDYSEGELSLQQFCLRFKSKEIALEFKTAIDKSRNETNVKANIPNSNSNDNDDVIFVTEIQATSEEKQRAKDLMLPENFFTYKNKEPCPGCRGCKDDHKSPETSTTSSATVIAKVPVSTTLAVSTPNKTSSSLFWSPANSLYSTPSYFNKTADNTVFRTPVETNNSHSKENTPILSRNLMNEMTRNESYNENTNLSVREDVQKPLFEITENVKTPTITKPSILAAPKLGIMTHSESVGQLDAENKLLFGSKNKQMISENKLQEDITLQSSTSKTNDSEKINEKKPEVKSIFGSDLSQKGGNLFTTNTPGSIFGPSALTNNVIKPSIATSSESKLATKSDLSTEMKMSTFGNGSNLTSIWNFSQNTPKNTNLNKDEQTDKASMMKKAEENNKKEAVFKIDNNLSFAALSSSGPDFSVQKKSNFQWEGAGQQLFSSVPKVHKLNKSKEDANAEEEANTSANVEEEYDPHYEPIVPLPDKIDVVTGEEDEVKIFGERCKLYRYDEQSREWKERGVGEMKILFHPKRNTYRLLLRREQVHKAVLNMLLHMDLELLPLKNSDRAWTWAGRNHAENAAGEQETLAVRFKSIDLATMFKDKVLESVRKLQAVAAEDIRKAEEANTKMTSSVVPLRLPKHLQDSARVDLSVSTSKSETFEVSKPLTEANTNVHKEGQHVNKSSLDLGTDLLKNTYAIQEQVANKQVDPETDVFKQVHFQEPEDQEDDEDYEYEQNEDYEGYYNEEDEESAVYYACDGEVVVRQGDNEISCPEAHVQVMFDQEVYSPKILVTDNATGEILADMLIHTETEFEMSGDSCSWTGIDYTNNDPVDKTVTVHFQDSEVAMQFYDSCETSKAATYSSTDPES